MEWIEAARAGPYFQTTSGQDWTPLGQNDAVTWPELAGLFRNRDLRTAERNLEMMARHGVTCLRLMLEYNQSDHRFFERPAGRFNPAMVQLFDNLFRLLERHGLRVLLTPFDTFWLWRHWKRHPYNRANGGPCTAPGELLTCPNTREAIKNRLGFAAGRWGGSGALFAWDLWNEIHPAHGGNSAEAFHSFIEDVSGFVRNREIELYGRSHPQTVSVFTPHIVLDSERISEAIYRHPSLDFASTHFYEEGTIDDPANTVDAAISTGRLIREALSEIRDRRPFFDSEHGPIHTYKDHHKTLPEAFDDEYFRHMQWAHFASGGAGGGMRWPNRRPHTLTRGMRKAQRALAGFLPHIESRCFDRANWNREVEVSYPGFAVFACGDRCQAVLWLLRRDTIGADGRLNRRAAPVIVRVVLPEFAPGAYRVVCWDTRSGIENTAINHRHAGGRLLFETPPVVTDMAFAIRRING